YYHIHLQNVLFYPHHDPKNRFNTTLGESKEDLERWKKKNRFRVAWMGGRSPICTQYLRAVMWEVDDDRHVSRVWLENVWCQDFL
ncbi:MAG: hypothetical protein AAF035_04785, partial [Pseudomonadota bacterium]